MKRYILTGTPGCGKTSIIKELEKFGFNTVAEAATDIIALNKAKGITEPWKNKDFIDDIITLQKHRQQEISDNKIDLQFFDRSPICTYALAIYLKFIPSDNLMHEIKRILNHNIYEKTVFFVDNLGYIKNTEARKISFEESIEF